MDWSMLLKTGVLVDVKTKDGKVTTGFLDEVGISQYEKKILLTNKRAQIGEVFVGRKIAIENIEILEISIAGKANF